MMVASLTAATSEGVLHSVQNVVLISIPSVMDPKLAPPGKHTLHAYLPATEPFSPWEGAPLSSTILAPATGLLVVLMEGCDVQTCCSLCSRLSCHVTFVKREGRSRVARAWCRPGAGQPRVRAAEGAAGGGAVAGRGADHPGHPAAHRDPDGAPL